MAKMDDAVHNQAERESERMVNTFKIYKPLLRATMKLAGVRPQKIEVEPGTVMNIWAPTRSKKNANNGKKPAVVFLHGFVGDGILTWQFQVLALARDYAVYVPDLLFFGGSSTGDGRRTVGFQAECLARGLAKLGVQQCTVVGFSYGAMVAFRLAELQPELVESVVATSSGPVVTESLSRECLERLGFPTWSEVLLPDSASALKKLLEIGSFHFPRLPKCVFKHALEVLFDGRKERAELLEASVIPDKDFAFPQYSQKVHLVWGENDRIFPAEVAKSLKENLGDNATLVCIEKAGHIVALERPFVYNKCLKKILASIYKAGHTK
ncbi:putative aminoacrylate hydrolase RutD [Eucalyptus grandis]|uniref:putative aminoacrylate hydrolase RutD n=1 Tax=Eucalyptus grandis TaxID=71139 RepID=UPI00192ECC25|nr:putative aminoacrylate hydrolase RutD [Eucalyptus grandis]